MYTAVCHHLDMPHHTLHPCQTRPAMPPPPTSTHTGSHYAWSTPVSYWFLCIQQIQSPSPSASSFACLGAGVSSVSLPFRLSPAKEIIIISWCLIAFGAGFSHWLMMQNSTDDKVHNSELSSTCRFWIGVLFTWILLLDSALQTCNSMLLHGISCTLKSKFQIDEDQLKLLRQWVH